MTEVRVALPAHLRTLAGTGPEVRVELSGSPTIGALLDALEAAHPALVGTIRAHAGGPRRAYMRYHACGEDLSFAPDEAPLPAAVARGEKPFLGGRSDRRRVAGGPPAPRSAQAGAGQVASPFTAKWPTAAGARRRRTTALAPARRRRIGWRRRRGVGRIDR